MAVDPLEYHYETNLKLDYFILSAGIALLGWTVVNTDWIPKNKVFIYAIAVFWVLVIVSIICGVIKQLYNGMLFGLNHQYLHAGELANVIERSANVPGATFMDQQTGEISTAEEFKKNAEMHRETEKEGKELYKKFMNKAILFSNLSIIFLVVALFVLAWIKVYTLSI